MRRAIVPLVAVVALCVCAQPAAAAPRWPRHIARDYQMFTPAGNRAVRHVLWRASRMLRAGASRGRTMGMVRRAYGRVEDKYEEAIDTAVREAFADELDPWLIAAGYDPVDSYDEFAF
jgi:AcrR family transcriptional regulator